MTDIAIPNRAGIRTVGDMAQLLLEDEKAMRLKNHDLALARLLNE